MVFHSFSGGPVTRSKRTHPWMSGVTMLIRWLCSFLASARFPLVGSVNLRSSPASGNAPLGNKATREPTGCVLSKVGQSRSSRRSCCHWIGQGMHPTPSRRSESELLVLHFHRRPRPEFQDTVGKTCRTTKSKDKGKRPPSRGESPKGTTSRSPS